jgi:putative iron-only hydrogenase system regulator
MKKRAALISVILEDPQDSQKVFNNIVSDHHGIVIGRMGIPFDNGTVALISLTVVSDLGTIKNFTEQIRSLDGVTVNASIANAEFELQ